MRKLFKSCLGTQEVNSNEAPPNWGKHTLHNLDPHPVAANCSAPPPARTQSCTESRQLPPSSRVPQCSPAAVLPRQCFQESKAHWELPFLESAPFSVALVASDGKEVLFAKHGLEPTAAQLLDQALLFNSRRRPSNVPLAQQGGPFTSEGGDSTRSFLTALLGPELEAFAVHRARQARCWKGNITVQVPGRPTTTPAKGPIRCGDAPPHLIPPKAKLCTEGPAPGCHATTHEPASPAGRTTAFQSECAGAKSVLQEDIPSAATVAAGRVGLAPGVLHTISPLSSRRPSSIMVPGFKPAIKSLSSPGTSSSTQDDSSKRVQWVCGEADSEDGKSMPCPSKQIIEDTTGSPVSTHSRASSCRSLSSGGSTLDPTLSEPTSKSYLADWPSVHKAKSYPSLWHCSLGDGQEPGEGEEDEENIAQLESKASRSGVYCRGSRLRGKEAKPVPIAHPSFTRRSSQKRLLFTPEVAIEQLEQSGSGPDECATRTVALLKSITQKRVSEDVSCQLLDQSISAPPTQQHQSSVIAGPSAMLSHLSAPAASSHESRTSTTSGPQSSVSDMPAATDLRLDQSHTLEVRAVVRPVSDLPAATPAVVPYPTLHSSHTPQQQHSTATTWCPSCDTHNSRQGVFAQQPSPPRSPLDSAAAGGPSANGKPQSGNAARNSDRSVQGAHAQFQPTSTDPAKLDAYVPTLANFSRRSSGSVVQNLEDPLEDSSQADSADPLSTVAFLRTGSSPRCDAHQASLTHTLEPGKEQQTQLYNEASSHAAPQSTLLPERPQERSSEPTSEVDGTFPTHSFDVMVSTLSEDARSPLLVVILNCTEHMQLKETLVALAESQLELLSSCMPQHAIQFLATESTDAVPKHVSQLARAHQGVTILFMDVVGFTQMSKNVKPVEVMVFLNKLFSRLDRLTDEHGVHKVETAGDCYIVAGGVMSPTNPSSNGFQCVAEDQDPAESAKEVMDFAKALLETAKQVNMPDTNEPVRVRVGLHTGDVVSGLIGSKMPKHSIFGDAMNTASRMESTGIPGRIHVSETTQELLQHESWESTGGVEVKGKGKMQTYLWVPPEQLQAQHSWAGTSDPLPCLFIKRAHTLLRHLGTSIPALPSPLERLKSEAAAYT